MQLHSHVGLVTNSSSETYTWPLDSIEATLRSVGMKMLAALGIMDKSFDDVFEIRKTLSGSFQDKLRYNEIEGVPEGIRERMDDAQEAARDLLVPEGCTEPWYKLENQAEIREAMKIAVDNVIAAEIDIDAIPMGGGWEGDGYTNGNLDFTLVVKATGYEFNFESLFGSMYSQESCFNG